MRKNYVRKFNQETHITSSKREILLDFLRGAAVFLMILAHFAYFLNDGSNIIKSIQDFGDTNAFVIFLFVSGVVTFITYQRKKENWQKSRKALISRILNLLLSYYFVAIVSHSSHFTADNFAIDILRILTFQLVPGFTEFLLVFLAYSIIYTAFPKLIERLGSNLGLSIIVGLTLYALGYFLYFVDLGESLNYYKMLLSGQDNFFRFPMLQYFIVFSIGLNFGSFLDIQKNPTIRQKRYFQFFIVFASIILLTLLVKPYSIFAEFGDFQRWPPTLSFMTLGISLAFLTLFTLSFFNPRTLTQFPSSFILNLGKDAYLYFISHIVILQMFDIFFDFRISNIIFFIFGYCIFLIICSIVVNTYKKTFSKPKKQINVQIQNSTNTAVSKKEVNNFNIGENQLNDEISKYNFYNSQTNQTTPSNSNKTNDILIFMTIALIIGSTAFILYFGFGLINTPTEVYAKRNEEIQTEFINKRDLAATTWWNFDYSYQRKVSIYNTAVFANIQKGDWLSFSFDHKSLVDTNKSLVDARDLRVVYQVDQDLFTILPTQITNKNSEDTTVAFQVINDINSKESDRNYYMYYGNFQADQPNQAQASNVNQLSLINTIISAERKAQLSIETNRTWVLKGLKEDDDQKLQIVLDINSAPFPETQTVEYRYRVLNSRLEGKLFADQDGKYYANIDVSELDSDVYHIQAVAQSSSQQVLSPKKSFIVSDPLFVTWTMDWEGLDPRDNFLTAMDRIANQYDIPISHYFNPRIYIALPEQRSRYLTDWVKERAQSRGDSIDLHLHMFYDMAQAAGINPRESEQKDANGNIIRRDPRPIWGSPNQDGYDVITTSYTYEETKKVIEWALDQFERNGLERPKGYRAGGWYLDLENMRALEELGFKHDSSGRTSFIWGSNRLTNPWNLQSTTQPYYPSTQNQNSSNPPPNFSFIEFPNNGADSYTFSGQDMINRFNENYSGTFLEDKRIVTYLSHPHWFNIDEPKLDELFSHIGNFLYKNDKGPVVYIDMDDAYYYWVEQEQSN